MTAEDINGHDELPEALRSLDRLCSLRIDLLDGGEFTVEGFGLPFANPGHPSHDWINSYKPIIGDLDLLSLLRRRSIHFLLPQKKWKLEVGRQLSKTPFRYPVEYPFGETEFSMDSYKDTILHNMVCTRSLLRSPILENSSLTFRMQGHQFKPYYTFDDDQQNVCSNAMSQVMDIFWTHKTSCEILEAKVPAYFVPSSEEESANPNGSLVFAVIHLTEAFREQHKSQWARLTKDGLVDLVLHSLEGPDLVGKIMERPDTIPCLENKHALDKQFEDDLVVRVRVSDDQRDTLKTFEGRVEAEEALKVHFLINDTFYRRLLIFRTRLARSNRIASRLISKSSSLISSARSEQLSLSCRGLNLCRPSKTPETSLTTCLSEWPFTGTLCAVRAFTAP